MRGRARRAGGFQTRLLLVHLCPLGGEEWGWGGDSQANLD